MTDPLIAAGSDELDYRYPGAMRWSPDVQPCMATTPGFVAMAHHPDHICERPAGHPYATLGSPAYAQTHDATTLMHQCSCGVAFGEGIISSAGAEVRP